MSETCYVLLVDDDTVIRTALAEVLRLNGFDAKLAAHGREALAILGRWRPDVIVTDLNMPVMDGWAFLDELRRRRDLADIPVIVLSAARLDVGSIDRLST